MKETIYDFKEQVGHPLTEEIKKIPFTEIEDIPSINDKNKYNWVECGTEKYCRSMYCTITKIRRSQTMGEFYQGGIVD